MLKYVGNSSLPGIPARDLSDEEVRKHGKTQLIMSGLYIEVQTKMKQPKYENKNLVPVTQDKSQGLNVENSPVVLS